jgi:plastocyanin
MKTRVWLPALAIAAGISSSAFADVKGTVKLEGKAPEMPKIDMSGVPDCHKQHADKPVSQETVVVGKDSGLANVVVSIKKAEGQSLPGDDKPPTDPVFLNQKGCQYVPHVVAAMVGQPLSVRNEDAFLHNVHTQPEKNDPDNKAQPNIDPKGTKLKTPKEAEYYRVKCDVHPWMAAWVAVIDNPYFAVTDADGHFTLPKGLPDGDYTLHVWHEKYGEQDTNITVKGGNADASISVKG